jgi:nucleoid-associated protein YgaU
MRALSFLLAVAMAAFWVDAAWAEAAETAPSNSEHAAQAEDDPFAEFAEATEEAEVRLGESEGSDGAAAEPTAAPVAEAAAVETVSEPAAEPTVPSGPTASDSVAEADAGSEMVMPEMPKTDDASAVEPTEPTGSGSDWSAALGSTPEPTATTASGRPVVIGPMGVDSQGRRGRIHTVTTGDTLWDISNAYLGTPWVWPSVWHENDRSIDNPHLIRPGDLIWITSTEMRRVTAQEAEALMAGAPTDASDGSEMAATGTEEPVEDDTTALPQEGNAPGPASVSVEVATIDLPADIDGGGLSVPGSNQGLAPSGGTLRIASREYMSFVSSETIEAQTSIVESPFGKTWLASGDTIHVGIGEGEVEKGDQFTIFRDHDPVRDMRGRLLGYQIEVLGWIEIQEVSPETSEATVKVAVAEMRVGDLLAPREIPPNEVTILDGPKDFEGHVIHFPDHRTVAGTGDYLYLDRGSIHGLEVGSHLEVVAGGSVVKEPVRRTRVATPPLPVSELVVVSVRPDAAVAVVTRTRTEIERGARVRAAGTRLASND